MLAILLYFSVIGILTILFFLFFFKNKKELEIYFIFIIYVSLWSLLNYEISISTGREGYSILTKQVLEDELIYHNTAIYILKGYSLDKILDLQEMLVGYSSYKSYFFSLVIAFFYKVFIPDIIIGKALITVFSAIFGVVLFRCNKIFLKEKYAYIISLILLLYPNYIIHSIQLEKDIFLLILLCIAFKVILFLIFNRKVLIFDWIKFIILVIVLFFMRPQFAVLLLFSLITVYLFKFKIFYKRSLFFYIIVIILLMPLPILILKYYFPTVFILIDTHKNYSVFAGIVGFLKHDYSSYFTILQTLLHSMYYFLLGPISSYLLQVGLLWKSLIVEPIIFTIFPIVYIMYIRFFRLNILTNNIKIFIKLLIIWILFYSYISTLFESHFSAYLRKRIIVYIFFIMLFFVLKQSNKKNNK